MLKRSLLVASCMAATLAMGCQEHATAPVAAAPSASSSAFFSPEMSPSYLVQSLGNRGPLVLPSNVVPLSKVFGDIGRPAIDPNDYVCEDNSPVIDYLNAELSRTLGVEPALFFAIYNRFGDLIPTYEALYFGSSSTPQTYGYKGQFTKAIVKTERDIKRFWDIPSSDIQVLAMHGTMLLDVQRVSATYVALGFPPATAQAYAIAVRDALLASKTMNGGNFAFFTFNAFAFSTPDHSIPDKIVMGDGILEAFAAVGYGDVAPQAIFAHEFAHHIQFENNYFDDLPPTADAAEQTRYTELMADAMAAYYMTHKRGGTLKKKRVEEFLSVFYQIGDCGFASSGHHGTPNQRMAAARWGFDLADQAQKQGHILTSAQVHALFVQAYPSLIAPDAP